MATSSTQPATNKATANAPSYVAPKKEFRTAWHALRALMANPEDTKQVFTIMRALTGNSMYKQYKRFAKTDIGANILANEIDLLDTLADRNTLARLPEGSLGRVYLDFMTREGISAEGLVEASEDVYAGMNHPELERFSMRSREMHDLWHVISGYGRDGLGEICVVAFSYAQTKSLGFAAIAAMGAVKYSRAFPGNGVLKAVWQAYRNGRKTAWLPGQNWEHLLTQPYEDVRAMLQTQEPTHYKAAAIVSAQTRPDPVDEPVVSNKHQETAIAA